MSAVVIDPPARVPVQVLQASPGPVRIVPPAAPVAVQVLALGAPGRDADATAAIAAHADSAAPHAAYDDMPSLSLLFENRLL